jgi:hypothetical protein
MQSGRKSQTNSRIAGVEEQEKEHEHTQEKIVNEGMDIDLSSLPYLLQHIPCAQS